MVRYRRHGNRGAHGRPLDQGSSAPAGILGPDDDAISCVAGAASIAALWWRRRFPLVLACALLVCSTLLPVVSGPSLVALFTVAGHSSLRPTIWATLLALCSTPVQVVVGSPLRDTDFWRGVLALSLAILLVVGWGIALRSRRQVLELLQERARALARERDLVADGARRAEREEIARDVHDSLAHRLSLISMSAGALNYRREEIPAELAEQIATLQGTRERLWASSGPRSVTSGPGSAAGSSRSTLRLPPFPSSWRTLRTRARKSTRRSRSPRDSRPPPPVSSTGRSRSS